MFLGGWTKGQVGAFLNGVPMGRALVLDLESVAAPLYQQYDSYFGQPFVFNMLHNFGGTSEMRGSAQAIGPVRHCPIHEM